MFSSKSESSHIKCSCGKYSLNLKISSNLVSSSDIVYEQWHAQEFFSGGGGGRKRNLLTELIEDS